jgi:hypothetical protein
MSVQYLFCPRIDFWLLSSGKIFSERLNGVKAEKKMINLRVRDAEWRHLSHPFIEEER